MSQFNTFIDNLMFAGMDQDAIARREYVSTIIDEKKVNLPIVKASAIEAIEQKLEAAKARSASASVITAYEKCLAQLVN